MENENKVRYRVRLGMMLEEQREREGWSRQQVAEMTGLTEATVRKVEEGVFNVPLDVLATIADVYGCNIGILPRKENGHGQVEG